MLLDEGFVSRSRLFEKGAGRCRIPLRQRGAGTGESFPANKRWRKFFAGEFDQHFFGAGEIPLQHEKLPANWDVVSRRKPTVVALGIGNRVEDRFRGGKIALSDH